MLNKLDYIGKRRPEIEADDVFPAQEGECNLYYGQIGSGKSYGATADIIDDVRRGEVVYATWPVSLEAFDDRTSLILLIVRTLLFRKIFYRVDCPKNFHYIDAERGELDGEIAFKPDSIPSDRSRYDYEDLPNYVQFLNTLNHCKLYIDEAWRVIDSYKGTMIGDAGRNLILVTGHKYRTVNLITQRPTGVHVTARGNCNRFYKFVKVSSWPWVRFARYEFQEMAGETVDETKEPISVKRYWLNKRIADSYNSHYYGELKPLHERFSEAFDLSYKERLFAFRRLFSRRLKPREKSAESEKKILPNDNQV